MYLLTVARWLMSNVPLPLLCAPCRATCCIAVQTTVQLRAQHVLLMHHVAPDYIETDCDRCPQWPSEKCPASGSYAYK